MSERPRREWSKVGDFVTTRCARAKHSSEWTSELTLFAHYRRWSYLRELNSVNAATFRQRLDKKHGEIVIEINGHRCYPLIILDADKKQLKKQAREQQHEPEKQRGEVRVRCDMLFVDGVLEEGTVLPWLATRRAEKQRLKGTNDLVVKWRDKRRYIRGDDVEPVG